MRANISRARARRDSRSALSSSSTKSVNEVCFSAAFCASAVYCAATPPSRRWALHAGVLNRSRPRRGHPLQTLALQAEAHQRDLAGGRMHPGIGDLAQPGSNPHVSRVAINFEPFGAELARKRHTEARPQVSDEALDFALGLRPIRPAQPRHEAMMMREVEEGPVVAI